MDIIYLGHSSFKIKGKNATLVTDPFDPKMVGIKYSGVKADIVTSSHDHFDHNNISAVGECQFVVNQPGEYEIKDVTIIGIPSFHDDKSGEKRGSNIICIIEIDGLRIVHLGDLGHKLSESQYDNLGEIDILLIPVGGEFTINAQEASDIVREIEPRIIIPMHYQVPGLNQENFSKLAPVDNFLQLVGLPTEKTSKLTVKKDLLGDSQKVVILEI